jgi:addiction module RelB/DinJ family antitoxin
MGKVMKTQDVRVTIRVNRELKENAEALFEYLGLNMSNAINIFLRKAVDQKGIPFSVKTGTKWGFGLDVADITGIFNDVVAQDIEGKQKKGLPIARYDIESGRAYLENADGSREYV